MPTELGPSVVAVAMKEQMKGSVVSLVEAAKAKASAHQVHVAKMGDSVDAWKAYWASVAAGSTESALVGYAVRMALRRYIKDNKGITTGMIESMFVASLVAALIAFPTTYYFISRRIKAKGRRNKRVKSIPHLQTFDYIVLGSELVAARLSEDPTVTVLFVPAVNPTNSSIHEHIRGNRADFDAWGNNNEFATGTGGSSFCWNFDQVLPFFKKSENFQSFSKRVAIDRGYHSCTGLLKVFKCSRPSPLTDAFIKSCFYLGIGSNTKTKSVVNSPGYQYSEGIDYNGVTQFGASLLQFCEPAHDILNQFTDSFSDMHRENLTVLTGYMASRVTFKNEYENSGLGAKSKIVADGVFLIKKKRRQRLLNINRKPWTLHSFMSFFSISSTFVSSIIDPGQVVALARNEIILACGALETPKILTLSGIADQNSLAALGIPVLIDLPAVGQNLQDYIQIPRGLQFENLSRTVYYEMGVKKAQEIVEYAFRMLVNFLGFEWPTNQAVVFYKVHGNDSDLSNASAAAVAVELKDPSEDDEVIVTSSPSRSPQTTPSTPPSPPPPLQASNTPDIQLLFSPGKFVQSVPQCLQFTPILLHPQSGTLTLQSSDPFADPLVTMDTITTSSALVSALRDSRQIVSEMRKIMPRYIGREIYDSQAISAAAVSSENIEEVAASFEYLHHFVAAHASHVKTYSGTCRMGRLPANSVVSGDDLKIHGVKNLRVADASVFMSAISAGRVDAASAMVAEVCAAMVQKDHKDYEGK
ncbi:hypothetical protein HK100_012332 [Physocladia obscura]|uniref:Glucose-methanol-choline oxidoreductase N-terminal domain-containing protein n=1 Tax=Physocladia obscura TaxID=109957 RepID=A0AAD5XCJ7_9FUNG|nr:hypothetical protein HK100_012332 [Physocladia obscura]